MKTKLLIVSLAAAFLTAGCAGPQVRHEARVDRRYDRYDRRDDRRDVRYDRRDDRYNRRDVRCGY